MPYTNKAGEVIHYNQKEYNKRHYENNKAQILEDKYLCESCNKLVNVRNKTNHVKTEKHRLYERIKLNA